MSPGEIPVRFSQVLQLLSLLEAGTVRRNTADCHEESVPAALAGWASQRLLPGHGVVLAEPHNASGSEDTPA